MSIAKQFEDTMEGAELGASSQMQRHGLTLAVVTNINDEEKLNRVKCIPIENGQKEETDWCYVMAPLGGKQHGQFFFPNVDDLVVLGYLGGDPHRPFVLGAFWNTEVAPPYVIEEGKVHNFSIKTPGGTELLFYDEPDKQRFTVTLPSGSSLVINDEAKEISLSDKDKKNLLSMSLQGGEITLQADQKLTLSAGSTKIVLEASGNLTQSADSKISMSAATLEGKASASLSLKGAAAEVKADGTLTLQASGPTAVKGAIVQIN